LLKFAGKTVSVFQNCCKSSLQSLSRQYMSTAWARWQQQQQAKGTPATVTQQQQAAALQRWQQLQKQLPDLSWQQLDASAVLPQEVVACVPRSDRRLVWAGV